MLITCEKGACQFHINHDITYNADMGLSLVDWVLSKTNICIAFYNVLRHSIQLYTFLYNLISCYDMLIKFDINIYQLK